MSDEPKFTHTEMRNSAGRLFWRGPTQYAPLSIQEVIALAHGATEVIGDYRGLREPDEVYSVRIILSEEDED